MNYDCNFDDDFDVTTDLEKLCQEIDEEERRKVEKAQKKRDNKKTKLLNKKKKSEQNGGESKTQAETENPSKLINGEKLQPDLEHEHPENEISSRSRSLSSSSGKQIERFNRKIVFD